MAKVQFPTSVKYDGELIPANTPFSVKDEDLEELKIAGAFVIEAEAPKEEEPVEEPVDVAEVEEPEVAPAENVEDKKPNLADMVSKPPKATRSRKATK